MTIKLIFQMAFILRPECNFHNGYFRCLLSVKTVDMEVKVKMVQGIHTFRRDRTSQIIKCNPWSTKLCPNPSLIQKMKRYLELEGKLGPKPRPQPQIQLQPTQPQPTQLQSSTNTHPQNNIPMTRKAPGPKTNDKKRRTMLAKRRYKVKVIAQPIPTTPTPTAQVKSTAPTPTQTPMVKSTAMSILITVCNLTKGKFSEIPYPTERPQNEGNPSVHNSNSPPLEDIPIAPVRDATPWPSPGSASENLFEARKDWQVHPTPAPTVKTEAPPQLVVTPHAMVMPICKNEEEHGEEDWNSDRQTEQPRNQCPQNTQHPQSQNTQHLQSFDVPDRYSEQIRLRGELEEKMECLNEKYNLDYYSSSESDSDFEP